MATLARAPKQSKGVVVELSPTLRAVIYGHAGHTLLVRDALTFRLDDLEAAKLDRARADYLRDPAGFQETP